MAVFAYVKNALFSLKFRKTSNEIISERSSMMMEFVNQINSKRADKSMQDEIWNQIAFAVEVRVAYSFNDAIKNSHFYKILTPKLKERLIN